MLPQLSSNFTLSGLAIALNIFNFPEDYKDKYDLQLKSLRFLIQNRTKDNRIPSKDRLEARLLSLHTRLQEVKDEHNIIEAVDIATEIGNTTLINRNRWVIDSKKRTVYEDKQNVHDSSINESVIHAAQTLQTRYRSDRIENAVKILYINNIKDHLIGAYIKDINIIEHITTYILTNVATFGVDISLKDTMVNVWLWMHEDERKNVQQDLEKRLVEEMYEMKGLCSTGHLSRLISSIQGFTDDNDLTIKISEKDQYSNVIKKYLEKLLKDCNNETVMEGMTEATNVYRNYIKDGIAKVLLTWEKEYGNEIIECIPKIVNGYCGTEIFK